MRILILLLMATALAGCTGGDDTDTTPTTTTPAPTTSAAPSPTTTSAAPSPTTTTSPPPAENTPPTATLSAATENGTFNVTFDIDGADEDGDTLSWSLDADGDGTEDAGGDGDLPAQYVHDYGAAGNYTAMLTVGDGEDEASEAVDLVLVAGQAAGQTVTGTLAASGLNCLGATSGLAPASTYFPEEGDGTTHAAFDVAGGTVGGPFTVAYEGLDGPASQAGLVFADADDAILLRIGTWSDGQSADSVTDLVPEGSVVGYVFSCQNEPSETTFTYEAGPSVEAPPA